MKRKAGTLPLSYVIYLIDEIKADGIRVIIAGDAMRPRKIMDAVREGNFAAYQL